MYFDVSQTPPPAQAPDIDWRAWADLATGVTSAYLPSAEGLIQAAAETGVRAEDTTFHATVAMPGTIIAPEETNRDTPAVFPANQFGFNPEASDAAGASRTPTNPWAASAGLAS